MKGWFEVTRMLGAIAGDIIGSVYEGKKAWLRDKTPSFEPLFHPRARFTDDTILTVAVADSILHGHDLVDVLKDYPRAYPGAGYGGDFERWACSDDREPYYSWGTGAATRVSPVGFAYDMLDEVILRARWTAEVTHNHPDAIKGAQAVAAAICLARSGSSKEDIGAFIERKFSYDLSPTIEQLRPSFRFDVSAAATVPPSLIAFLESTDFESAVRLAISLGGDCDTMACIAGGIAQAYYGLPDDIRKETMARLTDELRSVVVEFDGRYPPTR